MDYDVEYAMQSLYIAKIFYDHDRLNQLLQNLHDHVTISWDELAEIERAAVQSIFEDSRCYWHQKNRRWRDTYESDREVYVLRDPLLTRYDALCQQYEAEAGITTVENQFVRSLDSTIQRCLQLGDYSYDYRWMDCTQDKKGAKIVLSLFEEFMTYYNIPNALFSILDFCAERIPDLESALANVSKQKVGQLPQRAVAEKEAA